MNPRNEEKKQQIYEFINEYIAEKGYSPSTAEISEAVGCAKSTVSKFTARLAEEGKLKRAGSNKIITDTYKAPTYRMPVVGTVSCGKPTLAVEDIVDSIPVDTDALGGGEFFGLIADGDSMIDVGIEPGDVVYVRRQSTADDGEIAVVMLEDEFGDGPRATLKRFFRDNVNKSYILHPENSKMKDIIVTNVRVIGVAKRVLKTLK